LIFYIEERLKYFKNNKSTRLKIIEMAESHHHNNVRPHYEPLPEPKLPFLLKLFDAPATFIRGLLL
jgi:hypothetical protein